MMQNYFNPEDRIEPYDNSQNSNYHDLYTYNKLQVPPLMAPVDTSTMYSGRYGHVLKPDGSYIEPKDFIDQFSIHMHRNRQEAFQGMTKQEMEEAERCVQHFREEHMGKKPQFRRNAFTNEKNSPFNA